MPTIRIVTTLAASGSNANILSGNRFEFLPTNALIRVFAIATGTGISEGEVTTTISLTNVVLLDGGAVPVNATGPNRNEHLLVAEAGAAGDRLIISAANSDGANAATLITLIDVVPA